MVPPVLVKGDLHTITERLFLLGKGFTRILPYASVARRLLDRKITFVTAKCQQCRHARLLPTAPIAPTRTLSAMPHRGQSMAGAPLAMRLASAPAREVVRVVVELIEEIPCHLSMLPLKSIAGFATWGVRGSGVRPGAVRHGVAARAA